MKSFAMCCYLISLSRAPRIDHASLWSRASIFERESPGTVYRDFRTSAIARAESFAHASYHTCSILLMTRPTFTTSKQASLFNVDFNETGKPE